MEKNADYVLTSMKDRILKSSMRLGSFWPVLEPRPAELVDPALAFVSARRVITTSSAVALIASVFTAMKNACP